MSARPIRRSCANLQQPDLLNDLLTSLQRRNRELAEKYSLSAPRPLLLKIAPDLNEDELRAIIAVAQETRSQVSSRRTRASTVKDCRHRRRAIAEIGDGGLSGAPLAIASNEVIRMIYRLTNGTMPIVGVGGVFTAEDAWEKICAGASLIQIYTGFIYEGPGIARRINEGLRQIVSKEGFVSLDEAVGCRA